MIVTGHDLREAIQRWTMEGKMAEDSFMDNLLQFPEERGTKNPENDAVDWIGASMKVASLQLAQLEYNMTVKVSSPVPMYEGELISLAYLIKVKGVYSRYERLWRQALSEYGGRGGSMMFGRTRGVKKEDETYEEPVLQKERVQRLYRDAVNMVVRAKKLIATSNSIEVDISWLTEPLFPEE